MKLLFDQNLSSRLPLHLADVFPESRHVRDCGLVNATDLEIWNYARLKGYTIVSKDADFCGHSSIQGPPPQVIWLRVGNCGTSVVENLIRSSSTTIHTFGLDDSTPILVLP